MLINVRYVQCVLQCIICCYEGNVEQAQQGVWADACQNLWRQVPCSEGECNAMMRHSVRSRATGQVGMKWSFI